MKLTGPTRYTLGFTSNWINRVEGPGGSTTFVAPATQPGPQLYAVSADGVPFYIGVTKQSIRNRLRYGFTAQGEHGYYGYEWRCHMVHATLDIWHQEDSSHDLTEVEAVEAEVVFLIRKQTGQWPQYQTEIHFRPTRQTHRQAAQKVLLRYSTKGD